MARGGRALEAEWRGGFGPWEQGCTERSGPGDKVTRDGAGRVGWSGEDESWGQGYEGLRGEVRPWEQGDAGR